VSKGAKNYHVVTEIIDHQVHGVDAEGNVIIRRKLKRRYIVAFFQKLLSLLADEQLPSWPKPFARSCWQARLRPPWSAAAPTAP